jgi:hypothetical protein
LRSHESVRLRAGPHLQGASSQAAPSATGRSPSSSPPLRGGDEDGRSLVVPSQSGRDEDGRSLVVPSQCRRDEDGRSLVVPSQSGRGEARAFASTTEWGRREHPADRPERSGAEGADPPQAKQSRTTKAPKPPPLRPDAVRPRLPHLTAGETMHGPSPPTRSGGGASIPPIGRSGAEGAERWTGRLVVGVCPPRWGGATPP